MPVESIEINLLLQTKCISFSFLPSFIKAKIIMGSLNIFLRSELLIFHDLFAKLLTGLEYFILHIKRWSNHGVVN